APRHFRIAQRRTERWRVQFGAPSFPDCPAPHRKVARTVWRLVISGLPSAAPKGGAYSLAPRHFRIAQRRTERCRKSRVCAEAYMGTASGRGQVRDSVEILPMPPPKVAANLAGGPTAPPPKAVAKLAGGPTAPRRKRTFLTSKNPDGN
ncbi:MAG: hypothetical protein ACLQVJ_22805, partial [Syntrophobacteraceae bacterium]